MWPGLVVRARTALVTVLLTSAALVAPLLVPAASAAAAPSTSAAAGPAARPAAAAPAATPTAEPETSTDVSVHLAATPHGTLTPGVPLTLSALITNSGTDTLAAGQLRLAVTSRPLTDRSALAAWFSEDGKDAPEQRSLTSVATPAVPAGSASDPISITVPADALGLVGGPSSVFGLDARLDVPGEAAVDGRASVVWNATPASTPLRITTVVPITAPTSTAGLLSANDLQTFTSPNGILTRQLDGISGHRDVAIALDPRILVSIRALGSAAPTSAVQWLQRLVALDNESFPLQFGDADAAAQTQSGLTQLLQPTSFDYALQPSRFNGQFEAVGETPGPTPEPSDTATPSPAPEVPTLEHLLAWPYTVTDVAWPAGPVRAADITAFASNGLTTTIVSSANVDAEGGSTPGTNQRVGDDATALIADDVLSDALRAAITATSDTAWSRAMDRVHAELAMIATDGDGTRNLLATLPRGAWPTTGFRLAQTLTSLESTLWAEPATLSDALESNAGAAAINDATEAKSRLATVTALLDRERDIQQFSTVLVQPELLTGEARAELMVLLASAWLNESDDWHAAASQSLKASAEAMSSVRIVSTDANYNLVANEGSIPVTVSNGLPYAVKLVLRANPSNGRLAIEQAATKTVAAESRAIVLVPVKAQLGNGRVLLSLQLTSETGVPIGGSVVVPVTVNADWEGIGAVVVGGLLVLLFGFGLVRNIRRRRRERALERGTEAAEEPSG